ncbi:chaperone protein dnaJ GFA2, mitochondrial-like [Fagus crenata]
MLGTCLYLQVYVLFAKIDGRVKEATYHAWLGLYIRSIFVVDSRSLPFAGVDNDETIKVSRSGGADPDGNQPEDLYVVREDPVFRGEGADIHVDAVLSVTQAILGGTIQVPTLTGDVVLKVRPGTQPAQKVVLKKKG